MTTPIIVGPTAVGKTDLVLELSQYLNSEIINLDSRQIYKYLNIGTAKPTKADIKYISHHLIDFVDPKIQYSSFNFKKDFSKAYNKVLNENKIPIITGGTGFYLDTIVKPFIKVGSDYGLRKYLERLEKKEPGILRTILKKIDEVSFDKIHKNDLKRIIRAIEIYILKGKNRNQLKNESEPILKDYKIFVLNRDRKELHERINNRVDKMFDQGLLDEVKYLLNNGFNKNLNSLNTIGYKETIQYLEGKRSLEETKEIIKTNTRNYARRQIIYFRKYKNAEWLNLSSLTKEESIKFIIKDIKGV